MKPKTYAPLNKEVDWYVDKSNILTQPQGDKTPSTGDIQYEHGWEKGFKDGLNYSKFKFTEEDIHNLFDLLYMVEIDRDVLKLNNMDKWFDDFWSRLDSHVVPEKKSVFLASSQGQVNKGMSSSGYEIKGDFDTKCQCGHYFTEHYDDSIGCNGCCHGECLHQDKDEKFCNCEYFREEEDGRN